MTAQPGRPLTDAARAALLHLGVPPHEHASRPVSPELIREAEWIFCMTEEQKLTLQARFPESASKVQRLDPDDDLDDPSGHDGDAFSALGARLRFLVRERLAAHLV